MTEPSAEGRASERLDWGQIHARLERARSALGSDGSPTAEAVAGILGERARRLARTAQKADASQDTLDLLVFSLGGTRYAVSVAEVLETGRLRALVPVPGVPEFFRGVIGHRGRVIGVLDLGRLWTRTAAGETESGFVVVVGGGEAALGLLADEIHGLVEVPVSALGAVPADEASGPGTFFSGVTADRTVVVDAPALLGDPRIIVNDESE